MAKDDIVDVEGEEKSAGDPVYTGLVIFTTVALAAGFVLIEMAWAHNYGRGLFAGQ